MIEMENITKDFPLGERVIRVLKGVNLYISAGEFVSIMGPSGSGKSTLSSILGCLARPSSGLYKIDGREVSQMGVRELAHLRNEKIGFIFQDFNLLEGMRAWENVALPLFYAGKPPKERRSKALACLKAVGLEEKAEHLPRQLSGGQKQRVAIARALVNEPDFLFADEPTGALDKKTGKDVMALLQKLNLQGHTIVQVTHSSVDAQYSKRVLHIVDGLIVKDEIVERPTLVAFCPTEDETGVEVRNRMWRVAQGLSNVTDESASAIKILYERSKGEAGLIEAVRVFLKLNSDDGERILWDVFRSGDWAVRSEIVKGCGIRSPASALSFYFEGLRDQNAWVRFLSLSQIKRLGKLEFKEEQRALIHEKFEDPDERVRATVIAYLGQNKDFSLIEKFTIALKDVDGRVRANAIEALSSFLSKENEALLIELKTHLDDKNNRARGNACVILYPYYTEECFDTVVKMLNSENNLMRATAGWAIGQFPTDRGGPLLLERLKAENEDIALGQVIRSLTKLSQQHFSFQRQVQAILGITDESVTTVQPPQHLAA